MELGGTLNLDEVNTADPAVLVMLHSIVDDRGSVEVPGYGRVKAHENFNIILTMNKDYIGTNSLNEATRDRFTPIIFPNNKSIAEMLQERVKGAKAVDIQLADRVYQSIMTLVQDGTLSMDCVTVRGFIDAVEVSEDLGLKEALEDCVGNRVEDDEYRETVMNIIDDILG
jgi:midasin (ATPase involved in ribosome maturation)